MMKEEDVKLFKLYLFCNKWVIYPTEFCEVHTHYGVGRGLRIEVLGPIDGDRKPLATDRLRLNDYVLNRLVEYSG